MQLETRMSQQPAMNEWCLVCAGVVQDQVHFEPSRHLRVNAIQELPKFGRAVSAMQLPNDFATGHVERGEQRGCAMPLVVVGAPLSLSGSHRQGGLRAIERLDRTL